MNRLDAGYFPRGGSSRYSTKPLSIPAVIPNTRGPKWAAEWQKIQRIMYDYADDNWGVRGKEGKVPGDFIFFSGGYAEFKSALGQQQEVNLFLTGKMRDDLQVKYRLKTNARPTQVSTAKGAKSKNLEVGDLTLTIAFKTISSHRIAIYNEMGKTRRKFMFWTENEVRMLEDYIQELASDPDTNLRKV